jgi:hypothetical protein
MKKTGLAMILLLVVFGCATGQRMESLKGMPPDAPVKTVHIKGENCSWTPALPRQ